MNGRNVSTMESRTKCRTIVETLGDEILAGRYRAPMTFPSVERIVRRFGVAHLTAVRAMDELKRRGLVYSVQGSGTFVRHPPEPAGPSGRSIGLVVPAWPRSDFFPSLCREVSALCQTKERPLLFADTSAPMAGGATTEARLVAAARSLVDEHVSGILFHPVDFRAGADKANHAALEVFRKAGVPVVLLDCDIVPPPGESGYDLVGIDNVSAGWRLGEHVLARGARRLLFVSLFAAVSSNAQMRLSGLRHAAARKRGARVSVFDLESLDGAEKALAEQFRSNAPEAVVCSSDMVAVVARKALRAAGLRVPEDVLLAGVNDGPVAELADPPLTTIRQPCADIARVAFETLERRRSDPAAPPLRVFLPAPLVMRAATSPISNPTHPDVDP